MLNNFAKDHNIIKCIVYDLINFQQSSVAPPVGNQSYQLRNLRRLIRNNFVKDHNIIKCIVYDLINFQRLHPSKLSQTNLETFAGHNIIKCNVYDSIRYVQTNIYLYIYLYRLLYYELDLRRMGKLASSYSLCEEREVINDADCFRMCTLARYRPVQ